MKTKPYECWDGRNVGPDNPQIQNTTTPEGAVAEFGHQFECESSRHVWVVDPENLMAGPKRYWLLVQPSSGFEYSAREAP